MNVLAICSLNNLPTVATVGWELISFYLLAGLLFLIPYSLITAEVASAYPEESGIFLWVRDAFGSTAGLVAVWLQWISTIIWYPTLLSFVAGSLADLIAPSLAANKWFIFFASLGVYWSLTLMNLFGVRVLALLSVVGFSVGIFFPAVILIACSGLNLLLGHSSYLHFSGLHSLLPSFTNVNDLSFLVGITLSLAGLELSSTYANLVHNAKRNIPLAIILAAAITLTISILGSLALASLVPTDQIHFNNGITQAMSVFFSHFSYGFIFKVVFIIAIAMGGLAAANTWIFGGVSNLDHIGQDRYFSFLLKSTNNQSVNKPLLFIQGGLVTLFSSIFAWVPSINDAYWLLTILAGQFSLLMYMLLYATAIRLRVKKNLCYTYQIKGRKTTVCLASWGIVNALAIFYWAFFSPNSTQSPAHHNLCWHSVLLIGVLCVPIVLSLWARKKAGERQS